MVFQNYALYPHMSVHDNMAFALKLRKMSKDEIDRRVRDAAEILGLDGVLCIASPRLLSGGQRQRVAMGRAIVREPQAFLMDEPLSNLDAKLRVQMRAEIARLQKDLGVTTIYVTHDQTEAMTMGDRVALLQQGHAAAGRRAPGAVRAPGEPVRRRVHRLAGDEPRRCGARSRRRSADGQVRLERDRARSRCARPAAGARAYEEVGSWSACVQRTSRTRALRRMHPAGGVSRIGRPAGSARLRSARPFHGRRATCRSPTTRRSLCAISAAPTSWRHARWKAHRVRGPARSAHDRAPRRAAGDGARHRAPTLLRPRRRARDLRRLIDQHRSRGRVLATMGT